jgi:Heparinase II/III-like protein
VGVLLKIVPDAALALASTDRRPPRDQILHRLEAVAETRHLATSPQDLLELGPGYNFVRYSSLLTDLSLLSRIADDDRYPDHLRLVVDSLTGGGWRSGRFFDQHIQLPFVLGALTIAYDLFGNELPTEERSRWLATVREMTEHLAGQLATRRWGSLERRLWNHNILGYAGLGLGAVILDGPDASAWLDLAIERSRIFLREGVTRAGMTWEGISYCGFVFKLLGPFINAVELCGRRSELCPPEVEARLRNVPVWFAHSMFPKGGFVQNFNDAAWNAHKALEGFLASFAREQPDLCGVIWQRLVGAHGSGTYGRDPRASCLAEAMLFVPPEPYDPEPLARLDLFFGCEDVGYVSARDGWDDDASVLAFNCGPFLGELHDQSDNGSFTYVARGEPVVIDAGAANTRVEGSASSSLGHNLVFVDGRAEQVSGQGYGVSGTITSVRRSDHAVIVSGDATASYCQDGYNPVDHAVRHAAFVTGGVPYLLTFDDIVKGDGAEHDYDHVLHVPAALTAPGAAVGEVSIGSTDGRAVGRLLVLNPRRVSLSVEGFLSSGEPYREHTVLHLATRAATPQFVMLFLPAEAEADPACEVDVAGEQLTVRLTWQSATDELVFPIRTGAGAGAADVGPPTFRRS